MPRLIYGSAFELYNEGTFAITGNLTSKLLTATHKLTVVPLYQVSLWTGVQCRGTSPTCPSLPPFRSRSSPPWQPPPCPLWSILDTSWSLNMTRVIITTAMIMDQATTATWIDLTTTLSIILIRNCRKNFGKYKGGDSIPLKRRKNIGTNIYICVMQKYAIFFYNIYIFIYNITI